MKKFLAIILALALVGCVALADGIDWASMTDDEVNSAISSAKAEIERRGLVGDVENKTVFDENGVSIIITSFDFVTDDWSYNPCLTANIKAINTSDDAYEIYIENVAINGWETDHSGYVDIAAGHKEKGDFRFKLEDADVGAMEEIETFEISFYYEKPGNTFEYVHTDPIVINFK